MPIAQLKKLGNRQRICSISMPNIFNTNSIHISLFGVITAGEEYFLIFNIPLEIESQSFASICLYKAAAIVL